MTSVKASFFKYFGIVKLILSISSNCVLTVVNCVTAALALMTIFWYYFLAADINMYSISNGAYTIVVTAVFILDICRSP